MKKLSSNISIIQFHNITDRYGENRLWLPVQAFGKYLAHLQQSGFRLISIEEALQVMRKPLQLSKRRPLALTFDHGYADFFTQVYPMLAEGNIPAAVLISPEKVGKTLAVGNEKIAYLDAGRLREIAGSGITVGAYEDAAWNINKIDPATVHRHVTRYKKQLEDLVGREVKYFGVKEGVPSKRLRQLLMDSGYEAFLTQCPTHRGPDAYAVGRIQVDDDDFNIFLTKISRTYLFFKDKKSWRYIREYKLDRVAHRLSETFDRMRGRR